MLISFSLAAQTNCIHDFPETQPDSCEVWDVDTQYYDDCIDDYYIGSTADVVLPHCPVDYCSYCGCLVCDFPYMNPGCRYHLYDHEWWCPVLEDEFPWLHPCGYSQVEDDTSVILASNRDRDSNDRTGGCCGCGCPPSGPSFPGSPGGHWG